MKPLFQQELKVANVGLQGFGNNIKTAGGAVTQLSWAPPAGADADLGWKLAQMIADPRIEKANRTAFERYLAAQPRLVDLVLARDTIPGLARGERRILHAGPPIAWPEMCGPQQGVIAGAILYEGWANSLEAAEALAAGGKVALEPCHAHAAAGPMAGIISPSMPVWVVENTTAGHRAYCNLNEGLGKVLRFGANSPDVLERLRWLGTEFFETMQVAVRGLERPDLKPLIAQALHMGDEVHNRNAAASALLFKQFTLALLKSEADGGAIQRSLAFIAGSAPTLRLRCRRSTSAAHPRASTPASSPTRESCRSSTPASHIRRRASARSARASRRRRWNASTTPSPPSGPSCKTCRKPSEAPAMSRIAVVAFGGNALVTDAAHDSIPQQYETVCRTVPHLVDLLERGWRLVVSHGNGPQVGFILRRSEISEEEVDPVPVDYAVADTQGAIGYMFVKALDNELRRRGFRIPVVAVVTQTLVDLDDPAVGHPTKTIGSFLTEARARALAESRGWTIEEDAGRGWRRTVASPRPRRIVETEVIRSLLASGAVVIASGGGGIPVALQPDGRLVGVEAVVDKDLASGLLARELGADMLLIPTAVPRVAIRFGTPEQRWLDSRRFQEPDRRGLTKGTRPWAIGWRSPQLFLTHHPGR